MIITLYRVGKDGKTYYYTVHDRQPLLDAAFAICASWRIGLGKEREKLHRFESLAERDRTIRRLVAKRVKDGYKILYTFSRDGLSLGTESQLAGAAPTYPGPEAAALRAR
jgi:hypothetical protein